MPTVLGLLGGDYESKFWSDILSPQPREGVALMTPNNTIAMMRRNRLAVLGLRGATTVYNVDSLGGLHVVTQSDSATRALVEDAITYYQTADELYQRGEYRFVAQGRAIAATRPR